MKNLFTKFTLALAFGLAVTFILSCIPPTIVVYPANSYSSIGVDNSSSSETVPSSSSYSVEPSSSSSAEPSSSSVAPSSSSMLPSSSSVATYTIKYDANGGTGAPADQKKIHNAPLTLSGATPAKPGYTFASWNTAANGSGVSYAHGASYVTNASVTLYAQWICKTDNSPSVSYSDENNDETYNSIVICSQTWMARNLNYAVNGSLCYGDDTGGDAQGKCAIYGRL